MLQFLKFDLWLQYPKKSSDFAKVVYTVSYTIAEESLKY